MSAHGTRGVATKEAYLPWASSSLEPEYEESNVVTVPFVEITAVLRGVLPRSRTLSVPTKMTCADLKGHLAVEGVVSTCGGLEVFLEELCSHLVEDGAELILAAGQVVYLRHAANLVSITALATGGGRADEEVYELVVPSEVTGSALRDAIEQSTAGALRPAAIFVAEAADEATAHAVADEEVVYLKDEQAIIVHRSRADSNDVPEPVADPQPVAKVNSTGGGFFSALKARLLGTASRRSSGQASSLCILSASNVQVKGSNIACSSKQAWSSCVVFDVPEPSFFELSIRLLADAPAAEAEGLAGRWMLGVVPLSAAAVKTEADRRRLLDQGYFVTVCHGHPAKLHAPSTARGTCGEDCAALPGDLRKGQTLTIRWAAAGTTLTAQVDDCDTVTLPYSPSAGIEVRPCLVFGGNPAEVSVVHLGKEYGGA